MWRISAALALVLTLAAALFVANLYWPFRHRNMQSLLERVFASHITMAHYHRIYLPHPGFIADGIILRRNSAPDLPPVGTVQHVRVEGQWVDFLLLRRDVRLVQVDGLHIVIPPVGSRANHEDFPPGGSRDFVGPETIVYHLEIRDSEFDIQRVDGDQFAYPVHHLLINNLRMGQAISYDVEMQNATPTGIIKAHGTFGPVLARQLGSTPVFGDLTFAPVHLADVHGISGTLSLTGHFAGKLSAIEAAIRADTPDFAVGHGRPTHVAVQATGAVNALNGDILIHSLDATTGQTVVHAQGAIVDSPKVTNLDLVVTHGRAEDILRPFMHNPVPVSGAVLLTSHATIASTAQQQKFLDRLHMAGSFHISREQITNPALEGKLSAFSDRAQTHPPPTKDADVLSNLGAAVVIRHGIAHAERLTFAVPGATLNLSGTFNLRNQHADLAGDLRMQTGISHMTTGFKSFLLKPLTPFFRKGNAGTVMAITITGAPHAYKIRHNIFHHR